MGSRLVNPTREDQLMEVSSKSRLFTLKHLPFKCCLHMPHWEALQGEQKNKKAKFHQFRSLSCGSGQWLFCFFPSFFFCVFFSCYYRVKAHSICFEFWFFVFSSFFLWVCNLSVLEALEGWNEHREMPVCFVFYIQILFSSRFHGAEPTVCVFWWFLRVQSVVLHGERGWG